MTGSADWVQTGQGTLPAMRWSFATDAPLTDLAFARESGETLAADESGGLYRIDRRGRVQSLTRTAHQMRLVAMADDGSAGVAILDEQTLAWFDKTLQFRWTRELDDEVVGLAISPQGTHVVAALSSGMNVVYDADKHKTSSFESLRPLRYLQFVVTEPAIIAAADYGFFARYSLAGDPLWNERLWSTVNDLTITGDGSAIVLAGLAHGLQVFDGDGTSRGNFVLDGTAHRVSATYGKQRIVAATMERQLLMVETDGDLRFGLTAPEEITKVRLSPLGDFVIVGLADGHIVRLDVR